MGKETSDRAPESTYRIERYPDAPNWCDVVLYVDPQQIEDRSYRYDVYRLTRRPYRDNLAADIKANYDVWLAAARQAESEAALPAPTIEQRQEQVEAALIELAGIIAGGM